MRMSSNGHLSHIVISKNFIKISGCRDPTNKNNYKITHKSHMNILSMILRSKYMSLVSIYVKL